MPLDTAWVKPINQNMVCVRPRFLMANVQYARYRENSIKIADLKEIDCGHIEFINAV